MATPWHAELPIPLPTLAARVKAEVSAPVRRWAKQNPVIAQRLIESGARSWLWNHKREQAEAKDRSLREAAPLLMPEFKRLAKAAVAHAYNVSNGSAYYRKHGLPVIPQTLDELLAIKDPEEWKATKTHKVARRNPAPSANKRYQRHGGSVSTETTLWRPIKEKATPELREGMEAQPRLYRRVLDDLLWEHSAPEGFPVLPRGGKVYKKAELGAIHRGFKEVYPPFDELRQRAASADERFALKRGNQFTTFHRLTGHSTFSDMLKARLRYNLDSLGAEGYSSAFYPPYGDAIEATPANWSGLAVRGAHRVASGLLEEIKARETALVEKMPIEELEARFSRAKVARILKATDRLPAFDDDLETARWRSKRTLADLIAEQAKRVKARERKARAKDATRKVEVGAAVRQAAKQIAGHTWTSFNTASVNRALKPYAKVRPKGQRGSYWGKHRVDDQAVIEYLTPGGGRFFGPYMPTREEAIKAALYALAVYGGEMPPSTLTSARCIMAQSYGAFLQSAKHYQSIEGDPLPLSSIPPHLHRELVRVLRVGIRTSVNGWLTTLAYAPETEMVGFTDLTRDADHHSYRENRFTFTATRAGKMLDAHHGSDPSYWARRGYRPIEPSEAIALWNEIAASLEDCP